MKCRYVDIHSKLVLFEYLKNKLYKAKIRYYRRILLDEVRTKNISIRNFKQHLNEDESCLHGSTH